MQDQINAVQRMQDFISEHLDNKITLSNLAKVSYYSPWYSYRLFVKWTGLTPSDYIRRLRLSKSAVILRDEDKKIIDIASELGFGSIDGYQRAFLREFGCNPSEYSEKPVPLYLFKPYGVQYRNLRKEKQMKNVKTVFIQVIEKPSRKAIIKRGEKATEYWTYSEEVGCDVWGLLTSMESLNGEPVCLWLPKAFIVPNTSEYVQGIEVPFDYSGPVPTGFDVIELPEAEYLMFQGEPFAEEGFQEAIEQVREAIRKYDPSFTGYRWDTSNPRIQLEPIGSRGYIEMLSVIPFEKV